MLIEFALAAAGLIVLAFMTARVGQWLNQALVDRNQSFQDTRVAAASTSPGAGFGGPATNLRLIDGPGSNATQGAGSPPGAAAPSCSAAAQALYDKANAKRLEAQTLQNQAIPWDTTIQNEIERLQSEAFWWVEQSNYLWGDAQQIKQHNDSLARINTDGSYVQGINGQWIMQNGVPVIASCTSGGPFLTGGSWTGTPCLELIEERIAWIIPEQARLQAEMDRIKRDHIDPLQAEVDKVYAQIYGPGGLYDQIYGPGGVNEQIQDIYRQLYEAGDYDGDGMSDGIEWQIWQIDLWLDYDADSRFDPVTWTWIDGPITVGIHDKIQELEDLINSHPAICDPVPKGLCVGWMDDLIYWTDRRDNLLEAMNGGDVNGDGISVEGLVNARERLHSALWDPGGLYDQFNALWGQIYDLYDYLINDIYPKLNFWWGRWWDHYIHWWELENERTYLESQLWWRNWYWGQIDGIIRNWFNGHRYNLQHAATPVNPDTMNTSDAARRAYQGVPATYKPIASSWIPMHADPLYQQANTLITQSPGGLRSDVAAQIQDLLDEAWQREEEGRIMCSSGQ